MIYDGDPELRAILQDDIEKISVAEKYQILSAYINGGGVKGLLGMDEE